ncbi:MAG: NAD-dependent epimerase/dehydratase family protein [Halioglobus sp.]
MQIFITGASGFVGGATTRALLAAGHRIAAMSRSARSDDVIRQLGAQPVRCDLESITAGDIGSTDVLIHCAAFVDAWGPRDAWYKGNVLGTTAVLRAAQEAGVSRFIHMGTEAGIVHGQHLNGADETYPLAPNSPFPYCATKAQAEQAVLAANRPDFTTIVLRPRFIWGPGDKTLLPAIEKMSARGGWTWINRGQAKTSTIYIDNLVHAITLALTEGKPGEAYFILDDEVSTIKEIVTGMAASKNLVLGERNIPAWLADGLGATCEGVWRFFHLKSDPPLTRHAAMVMSRDCVLNGDKAKRELGYAPLLSVKAGLKKMSGASA